MKCRPMDDGTGPASVVSDPDNVLQGKELHLNPKFFKSDKTILNSIKTVLKSSLIYPKEEE